jgi:3-oxoacyl-[acyl-carrier protein] reductase
MGADIALVAINLANMEKVAQELRRYGRKVMVCETDVAKAKAVEAVVSRVLGEWGKIGILVNCAGIAHWAPAEEMKEEDWDRVMGITLKGIFLWHMALIEIIHPPRSRQNSTQRPSRSNSQQR